MQVGGWGAAWCSVSCYSSQGEAQVECSAATLVAKPVKLLLYHNHRPSPNNNKHHTGHCVTPQMGQGCNSALEDSVLLAQALEGAGHDIQAGLAAFERTRTPQVGSVRTRESWECGCAGSGCAYSLSQCWQSGCS